MAGRIPQPFIDEIVARSDIVEIIGARVPLKKSGREFKACCPFHNEKSPSFWVSPDKQFYHCFGCGAHGTAIGFLMQYEKMEFVDAVADLAQRAGLEIPREASRRARSPAASICMKSWLRSRASSNRTWRTVARALKYAELARNRRANQCAFCLGVRARILGTPCSIASALTKRNGAKSCSWA